MTTIDHIEFEVSKLQWQPGDTLLLRSDVFLTADQLKELREKASYFVPDGVKVMILTPPLTAKILHEGEQL